MRFRLYSGETTLNTIHPKLTMNVRQQNSSHCATSFKKQWQLKTCPNKAQTDRTSIENVNVCSMTILNPPQNKEQFTNSIKKSKNAFDISSSSLRFYHYIPQNLFKLTRSMRPTSAHSFVASSYMFTIIIFLLFKKYHCAYIQHQFITDRHKNWVQCHRFT